MQITYRYYKFPSKETALKKEDWPSSVSCYEIGTLYNNDAEIDELGRIIKPATPKSGWHINISYNTNPMIDLSFVQQYEIYVQTPSNLWLGQNS